MFWNRAALCFVLIAANSALVQRGPLGGSVLLSADVLKTASCLNEIKQSAEGQIVYARLIGGIDPDKEAKLADPNPLTKREREALTVVHDRTLRCRQIVLDHDNREEPWEAAVWQKTFQRTDEIFNKAESGNVAVGVINKLIVANKERFKSDFAAAAATQTAPLTAPQQQPGDPQDALAASQ